MIWLLGLMVLFYFPSLGVYFVQDDFWLFSISRVNTLNDMAAFFLPRFDVVWYRPLSSQIFFWLGRVLFGLQPLPYHLIVLLTHMCAAGLIYLLALKLVQNKSTAILATIFYGVNQMHVVSLSWLASFSFVSGPVCLVGALYAYLYNKKLFAWFLCLVGVLITEVLVIIPLIFIGYDWFMKGKTKFWKRPHLWYRA